jgi:catechol 2,3-dioxygenase-like lactoylglutathione lyase family enzyme
MKTRTLVLAALVAASGAWLGESRTRAQAGILPAPGFHHLHLNATNPGAAIDFYALQFPSTSKTTFAGKPALRSPNNVLVLFDNVSRAPALTPQTAIWHFGWHVTDVHERMETFKRRTDVKLLPLFTGDGDASVYVSSDTWPGTGGALGLTRAQIAEAKAKGVQPSGGAGFAYLAGPDGAIIEYQGNMPAERFNHVHYRGPSANITFGDVGLFNYIKQDDAPLASTRGHLADHFALSVANLDAWTTKLRGDLRALMIEGPSHEAIEIVEVK